MSKYFPPESDDEHGDLWLVVYEDGDAEHFNSDEVILNEKATSTSAFGAYPTYAAHLTYASCVICCISWNCVRVSRRYLVLFFDVDLCSTL